MKKRTKESNFNNRNKLYPSITRVLLFRKVRFIFNFVNCNHSSGVFRIDGVEFSELEINKQFHYFFFSYYIKPVHYADTHVRFLFQKGSLHVTQLDYVLEKIRISLLFRKLIQAEVGG